MARCYTRNGVWNWPILEQRRVLTAAGFYDETQEYCDEMSDTRARWPAKVHPSWLEQRGMLLRHTGRKAGQTVYVATLLAIALSETDLVNVLASTSRRGDSLFAVDSGLLIGANPNAEQIANAMKDWQRAKYDAQTRPGRANGNKAAAARKRSITLEKLKVARPLWGLTSDKITTDKIAEECGLSVKTLYTELGRRSAAQKRKRDRMAKRAEEDIRYGRS